MKSFRNLIVVVLALLLAQTAIYAQTTGSVSGTVTDPTGAVVSGASVMLKNNGTGEERSVTANDRGAFTFALVQPGKYTVTIEGKGFKKSVSSEVAVQVSQETALNIALEIGGVGETVNVTAGQEVVNSTSPTLTNVINTKQVENLPLSARNPLDLAALQAGIAVTGTGTRTSSIGGLRGSATNVTQDGINAMDNFVKTDSLFALSAPSLGSTSEFSITTGTTDSSAGRGMAQVNVVTKNGENIYHGSIFYLMRNSALNANNFFNNQTGVPRTDLHQHYYGFTIGGPVYFLQFGEGGKRIWDGHNKAFFFFSYEGFREKFQATRNRTVMTASARNGIFTYNGIDGVQRQINLLALAGIPSNVLNPITKAQLNAMPLPNNTLVGDGLNTAGARFNVVGSDPSDKYVGRYDHQLVERSRFGGHKLEFVYNRAHFSLYPDTFNGIEAPFPGGVNAGQSSERSLATGALVSTFGQAVNTFRYGRQWAPVGFIRDSAPTGPFVSLVSSTTFDNTFMSQGRNTIVNQYIDTFALPMGSHNMQFGGDYQRIFADTYNDAGINQVIALSSTNSSNSTGILQASFPSISTADFNRVGPIYADLVGLLGSINQTYNVTSASSGFVPGATRSRIFQQQDFAMYAQDTWRAKRGLTLNYGVRWEFEGVPTIPNGLAIQPDPDTIFGISGKNNLFNPNAPAGPPAAVSTLKFVSGNTGIPLYNDDWNNFAPFVGLAYSPGFESGFLRGLFGEQGKSSFRLGFSISYLHDGFTVISNAMGTGTTNPGLIQTASNSTPTGILSGPITLPAPVFTTTITDKGNFDLNPGNGLWGIDKNLKVPYVQQWNFAYQREVARDTTIEVRYVGNHAIKVFRAVDYNEVNIFENGFLTEFNNAKANLAARGGSSFAPGCAGCVPLPILDKFFSGLSAGSGYGSSTFISNLNNNNVGTMASTLAFSNTYKANRQNAALGLPANFFVANPNAAFARLLTNDSMSNYHSLQLEFRRRLSGGLQFQADYTFSKSLTDAFGAAGSQSDLANFRTLRNKRLDYMRSAQDQTHRFVANAVYDLPFGRGQKFLGGINSFMNQIFGNWTMGAIVTYQGRPPIFFTSGRTTFNNITTNAPAQLVGMSFADFRKKIGVFNTPVGIFYVDPSILDCSTKLTPTSPTVVATCAQATGSLVSSSLKPGILAAPAPGQFGNFPINSINGPYYFNIDMSLVKKFKVGERVRLELKTTAINLLNNPNWAFGTQNFDSTSFGRITGTSGNDRVVHFQGTMNF